MDAFGKRTGRLTSPSFSSLASTNAKAPVFVKASPAGTNNRGDGTCISGRATVTPSPGGQSTAPSSSSSSSSSRVEVPIDVIAQSSGRSSAPEKLPTYEEFLSLVNDLTHDRAQRTSVTTPMVSKAWNPMDPSSVEGVLQASGNEICNFPDGSQRGASDTAAAQVMAMASKVDPAVTEMKPKYSSPPKSDWRMVIDLSSFRPYYYHTVTNEVTWDKPAADSTGSGIWAEGVDESTGQFYYYHTGTGQVTWVNPFAFAQQNSLRKLMKQISRSVPHGTLLGSDPSQPKPITPFRGIAPIGASGKWKAKTSVLGKTKKIGNFENSAAASIAYEVVRAALDRPELPPNDPSRLAIFEAARKEARRNAMAMGCLDVSKPVVPLPLPFETTAGSKRKVEPNSKSELHPKRVYKSKSDKKSGLPKGVYMFNSKQGARYHAKVSVVKKDRAIGTYDTPEEAEAAYQYVRRVLDESDLPPLHEDRITVFEAAKAKVGNKSTGAFQISSRSNNFAIPKGVYQKKTSGKWCAQISVSGKSRNIGTFASSEEASHALAIVENALGESGLSRQDEEAFKVFKTARDTARASFSVKVLPRGVSQGSSGKFEARGPRTLGRRCFIGTFNTAGEAQSAVEAFANERQGIMDSNDEKELSLKIQAAKTKAKAAAIANAASHQRPSMAVVTLYSIRKVPSDISSERNKKKSGIPTNSHEYVSEQSKTTAVSITYAQCCMPGCTRQGFPFSKGLCVQHYPRGPDGKMCEEIQRTSNALSIAPPDVRIPPEILLGRNPSSATNQNRKSSGDTKGIHQVKGSGNWLAQIRVNGKSRNIGTFRSREEASDAFEIVKKALDESGHSRNDDDALEVFRIARAQARASLSAAKTSASSPSQGASNYTVGSNDIAVGSKRKAKSDLSEPAKKKCFIN